MGPQTPRPAQSIATIVETPELFATECNRSPGWPGASFDSLHGSRTLGMCRVAGWPDGSDSDAYDGIRIILLDF